MGSDGSQFGVPDVLLHEYKERCSDLRMRLTQYGIVWSLLLPLLTALVTTFVNDRVLFWNLIHSKIFALALLVWYSLLLNLNLIIENLNHHLFILSHEMNILVGESHCRWFVELRPNATGVYRKRFHLGFFLNQVPYILILAPAAFILIYVSLESLSALWTSTTSGGGVGTGVAIVALGAYVLLTLGLIQAVKWRNRAAKRKIVLESEKVKYTNWD